MLRRPPESYFEQEPSQDLAQKSAKGGVISIIAHTVRFLSQLVTVSILARLLRPEEFGYIAMATVLVTIVKMFAGQALNTGIIQKADLDRQEVSAFFWLSSALAGGLTLLVMAASPAVAWFFEEKVLTAIGVVLSLQVLFGGLGGAHAALLTRGMNFGLVATLDLVAGILSKIAGVATALLGGGYWALVVIPVSQDGFKMVMVWFYCTWRPSWSCRWRESRDLFRFGAKMSVTSIFNSLAGQVDGILIGKYLSSTALGLYSKSLNLVSLPTRLIHWPLESVAVSTLSKMQDDQERYRAFFYSTGENFLFFIAPLVAFLFVGARDIVLLVLGDQWHAAVPIFRYLSLLILLQSILYPVDWFLISTARLKKYLKIVIAGNVVRIVAIFIGLRYGPQGVALGLVVSVLIFAPVAMWYALRFTHISMLSYLRSITRVLTACLATMGIALVLQQSLFGIMRSHLLGVLSMGLLAGGIYLLCIYLLPGGRQSIKLAIDMAEKIIHKKRNKMA